MMNLLRLLLIPMLCLFLSTGSGTPPAQTHELIASAATCEEAQAIAEQYGIQLQHWESGVALYTTERDPQAVIDEGVAMGYPPLSPNVTYELFEP